MHPGPPYRASVDVGPESEVICAWSVSPTAAVEFAILENVRTRSHNRCKDYLHHENSRGKPSHPRQRSCSRCHDNRPRTIKATKRASAHESCEESSKGLNKEKSHSPVQRAMEDVEIVASVQFPEQLLIITVGGVWPATWT